MEKCKRELTIIFYRSYRYIVSVVDVICIYPTAEGDPAYPVQYLWVIGWTSYRTPKFIDLTQMLL